MSDNKVPEIGDEFLPGFEDDYEIVDVDEAALRITEVVIEQDDGSFEIFASDDCFHDAYWSEVLDCWVGCIE